MAGHEYSSQNSVDRRSAVLAASFLIALNQLVVNVQPLLLGALAKSNGLNDTQLGHVSAVFVGFTSLATLSAPLWVRLVNWRIFSMFAIGGAAIALFSGMFVTSLPMLLLLFAIIGVLKGCVGAPSFVSLGDTTNPERNYGISVAVQAILSAVMAVPMASYLIPHYGVAGVFIALSISLLIGMVAVFWLPTQGPPRIQQSHIEPIRCDERLVPPLLGMLALTMFSGGVLGFWYYMERIGAAHSVSADIIGLAVSGCSIATILGSLVIAGLGKKFHSLHFVAMGSLVIIAGYGLVAIPNDWTFFIGALLFACGWGVAQPAYWAQLRTLDSTSRLFVLGPASSGAAGVLTGVIAGPVIEYGGYSALMIYSSTLIALGVVIGLAGRILGRRILGSQSAPAIVA